MPDRYPPQYGMVGARPEHLERLREYGLQRVETVLLDPGCRSWLRDYLAGMPGGFSFHCPAFRLDDYPEYPLLASLVDPEPARREQSLDLMRRELDQAAEWGAQYLVAHLQRNLLMHGETAPAGWGEREGVQIAVETVARLLEEAQAVGVPVHLENMMGSPLLWSPAAYRALAEAVPEVRYCLDVGHAALDARWFGGAEADLARAMGPHLGSVHLYDNCLPARVSFPTLREDGLLKKYPVHPDRQGQPGWIDAAGCVREALAARPETLITFEVYYSMDTDAARTQEGLDWTVGYGRQWAAEVAVS